MNRTPRDLLLSRHADAVPRLDVLRGAAVAEERSIPARELMRVLFLPHRRLWLGLAAAWVAILVLNLFQPPASRLDPQTLDYAARLHANGRAQLYALLSTTPPLP